MLLSCGLLLTGIILRLERSLHVGRQIYLAKLGLLHCLELSHLLRCELSAGGVLHAQAHLSLLSLSSEYGLALTHELLLMQRGLLWIGGKGLGHLWILKHLCLGLWL